MTAPIKTCNYCGAVGVMPTFMNGETVCYDCLSTLPKTLREAWREIAALRAKIEQMEKQEPVASVYYKAGSCIRWVEYLGWQKLKDGTNLYALPGAKGEEK